MLVVVLHPSTTIATTTPVVATVVAAASTASEAGWEGTCLITSLQQASVSDKAFPHEPVATIAPRSTRCGKKKEHADLIVILTITSDVNQKFKNAMVAGCLRVLRTFNVSSISEC